MIQLLNTIFGVYMQINNYEELKKIERELSKLRKKYAEKYQQIAKKNREVLKLEQEAKEIEAKINSYFVPAQNFGGYQS